MSFKTIKFSYKSAAEVVKSLQDMAPKNFMQTVAVIAKNLAKKSAWEQAKHDDTRSGFWAREILPSIHENVISDQEAELYTDSYIAAHVHTGGIIRPRRARMLAIPMDKSVKGKFARDYHWQTPDHKPLFIAKDGKMFLVDKNGKRGKLKWLFVLKKQTRPQKPRPWWPSEEEVGQAVAEFFEEEYNS